MNRRIWTFFYGSYMNPGVLEEVDLHPEAFEVARLDGFDIRIGPLANLVQTTNGKSRPALCYIAPAMEPRPPNRAYVERVLEPARAFGFPASYIKKLETYLQE